MSQCSPQDAAEVPQFAVRIVSIDYYMSRPSQGLDECYSHLEGRAIDQVPVIRIFGSTPSGQKACVHVHRVRRQQLSNDAQDRPFPKLRPESAALLVPHSISNEHAAFSLHAGLSILLRPGRGPSSRGA